MKTSSKRCSATSTKTHTECQYSNHNPHVYKLPKESPRLEEYVTLHRIHTHPQYGGAVTSVMTLRHEKRIFPYPYRGRPIRPVTVALYLPIGWDWTRPRSCGHDQILVYGTTLEVEHSSLFLRRVANEHLTDQLEKFQVDPGERVAIRITAAAGYILFDLNDQVYAQRMHREPLIGFAVD